MTFTKSKPSQTSKKGLHKDISFDELCLTKKIWQRKIILNHSFFSCGPVRGGKMSTMKDF